MRLGPFGKLAFLHEVHLIFLGSGMWDHVPVVSYPKELNTKFLEESNVSSSFPRLGLPVTDTHLSGHVQALEWHD